MKKWKDAGFTTQPVQTKKCYSNANWATVLSGRAFVNKWKNKVILGSLPSPGKLKNTIKVQSIFQLSQVQLVGRRYYNKSSRFNLINNFINVTSYISVWVIYSLSPFSPVWSVLLSTHSPECTEPFITLLQASHYFSKFLNRIGPSCNFVWADLKEEKKVFRFQVFASN